MVGLTAVALLAEDVLALEGEHLGHGGTEEVGVEQSHLIAAAGQGDGQVGGDGALAHTALARADSDDVLHLGQHLGRLGGQLAAKLGLHRHLHVGADVGVDGGLGGLEYRLHERVGLLVEEDGEGYRHAVDAQVVLDHLGLDKVLAVAGVAHGGQGIVDEFGIECHEDWG